MVKIPERKVTTKSLLAELKEKIQLPGPRLGMAQIGDECIRKLWFDFRWATMPTEGLESRVQRIFDTGNIAENFIMADLERIGIKIIDTQGELWGFAKHARGFYDALIINVPEALKTEHILEIKTMNDRGFKILTNKRVEIAQPKHYAQMMIYMKRAKVSRALYIVYNKNTSEYYAERIKFDSVCANDLVRREREVILAMEAPRREFDQTWYACKYCIHREVCHYNATPSKTCRMCNHIDLLDDGEWQCGLIEKSLTVEQQRKACRKWSCS